MSINKPLSNTHIMVTRPAHQASRLIDLLEVAGAKILCLPLIEIAAIKEPKAAIEQVKALPQADIVIFISQNAVTHGMSLIHQHGELPANVKLATVGLGSANLLGHLTDREVEIVPLGDFNSEGLLSHPELQDIEGKKITIFRGIGGRNVLADTLSNRGARVSYAEVYQRQQPTLDLESLAKIWLNDPIDYICITSGAGIENLVANISKQNTPAQLRTNIINTQLIIVNKRLLSLVQENGFTKPAIITNNVSDKDIVDAIIKHKSTSI